MSSAQAEFIFIFMQYQYDAALVSVTFFSCHSWRDDPGRRGIVEEHLRETGLDDWCTAVRKKNGDGLDTWRGETTAIGPQDFLIGGRFLGTGVEDDLVKGGLTIWIYFSMRKIWGKDLGKPLRKTGKHGTH